jgi:hypothetical protein
MEGAARLPHRITLFRLGVRIGQLVATAKVSRRSITGVANRPFGRTTL